MKVNVVEIEEYFHQQLIKRGLIPTGKDAEEIADIVFNFLLEKEIIEEL
ncbi:YozD family protein [Priestia megaterium]